MQNWPSNFHLFSFQSFNFQFCQFSPLTFNFCQFKTPLTFKHKSNIKHKPNIKPKLAKPNLVSNQVTKLVGKEAEDRQRRWPIYIAAKIYLQSGWERSGGQARKSYGKARQSTPITDSVKAEQWGWWWWFTRRAGAARSSRGELSLSLSLSHKPAHSLSQS